MWPWSTIKRLRQELDDDRKIGRSMENVRVKQLEAARGEVDAVLGLANKLAEVVEQQAAEIAELRATVSTLRKTGVVINLAQEKKPP